MSGDRLIPDLANDPPPERDDDRRGPEDPERDRPRPERPPSPWDHRPPQGSVPPPAPPPKPPSLPPPVQPQPFQEQPQPQPLAEHPAYPYVHIEEEPEKHAHETTPYASRFQLILGALLGIAAVAIVAAVLVASGPKDATSGDSGSWSGWRPSSGDRGQASQ